MRKEFVRVLATGMSVACMITAMPIATMAATEENSVIEQENVEVNTEEAAVSDSMIQSDKQTSEEDQIADTNEESADINSAAEKEQESTTAPTVEDDQAADEVEPAPEVVQVEESISEESISNEILNEETSVEEVAVEEIVVGDVFAGQGQETGLAGFINRMYSTCLGRTADQGGLDYWVNALQAKEKNGADVGAYFIQSEELQNKNLSDQAYIAVLYQAFFNRAADAEGSAYWLGELAAGKSKDMILASFINSPEYQEVCDGFGIERGTMAVEEPKQQTAIGKFVERFYEKCMGRTPSQDEISFWEGQLTSQAYTGKTFAKYFVFSDEFQSKNLSNSEYIKEMYKIFFGRTADATGEAYWLEILNTQNKEAVFEGFVSSDEFKKSCEEAGILYQALTAAEKQAAYEAKLLTLVRKERASSGVEALIEVSGLSEAARIWAEQLAQGKVYKDANNKTVSQDYGERGQFVKQYMPDLKSFYVLSLGADTPEGVIEKWRNNGVLQKYVLADDIDRIGAGYYPGNDQWVIFITKK